MPRDNFSDLTKSALARNVRFRCVYPPCHKATHGPSLTDETSISVGHAAHNTAAAAGGPRFDESLTPEQRRAYDNGAWLCATHATLVDKDKQSYPAEVLQRWQKEAENLARRELHGVSLQAGTTQAEISQALSAFLPLAQSCVRYRVPRWLDNNFHVPRESVVSMSKLIDRCSGYHWHPGNELHSAHPVTTSKQEHVIDLMESMIDELNNRDKWEYVSYGFVISHRPQGEMENNYRRFTELFEEIHNLIEELREYMRGKN